MKKSLITLGALLCAASAFAGPVDITNVRYSGPFVLQTPYMVDKTDVESREFTPESFLKTDMNVGKVFSDDAGTLDARNGAFALPSAEGKYALHLLGASVRSSRYGKARLEVGGADKYEVYLDGKKFAGDSLTLMPGSHRIVLKCLTAPGKPQEVTMKLSSSKDGWLREENASEGRLYSFSDVLLGKRFSSASLSPDGRYLITSYTTTLEGGRTERSATLTDLATGRKEDMPGGGWQWMNKTNRYYSMDQGVNGTEMVIKDPEKGTTETVPSEGGYGRLSPNDDYMIMSVMQEGPKERDDVYEILNPEDRQPGWRNRSYLAKYDIATGVTQPLTYGYHDSWLQDISPDGKTILFSVSRWQPERPTTVQDVYLMDIETMKAEKIIDGDGFVNGGHFSPDGRQILFQGSPECLGGIGKNVRKDQIPSMTDGQLYIMDIASRKVRPMTKKFDPCVSRAQWNTADGKVYFMAENKDSVCLYRMDPSSGKIARMDVPEELVESFALAADKPVMVYCGQGSMNSDRVYCVDLKNDGTTLLEDLSKDILKGVSLGECKVWNFKNSRGDMIYGRYYLPPHFDASKKYPMIVNYYGGCSPTSRNFESRYPHHLYAAMGYVVYIINPSGATGFGQEFSARHVNTAGEGVAQDIIEGTQKFVKEHPFVDGSKIGCIGASYGGFMTQYLQTKTDIFAAAISHAGISDHTSYWGNGYWGYSYSETSMANSYPWTRKDLFVERSPLFNADKIHTPLLFLHGSADTNVPIMESVQMFTALKLLKRPTAFVVVEGQNHHILDYEKRIRWQDTIFAWFQKWLQDDPSWWESMYPTKNLE